VITELVEIPLTIGIELIGEVCMTCGAITAIGAGTGVGGTIGVPFEPGVPLAPGVTGVTGERSLTPGVPKIGACPPPPQANKQTRKQKAVRYNCYDYLSLKIQTVS